jgi:hypothetical protein
MKKYIIGIIVVVLAIVGLVYLAGDKDEKIVTDMATEIEALESEFAEIEAEVQSGDITPTQAKERRDSVVDRLQKIDTKIAAAANADLSVEARRNFATSLSRFSDLLIQFSGSLVEIDALALDADTDVEVTADGPRRGYPGSISRAISNITDTIQENGEDLQVQTTIDSELGDDSNVDIDGDANQNVDENMDEEMDEDMNSDEEPQDTDDSVGEDETDDLDSTATDAGETEETDEDDTVSVEVSEETDTTE